jgi:lipopolysaccharide/colanic/teichoic acid biosynthesis glycosyltransferase/glycosyltransferase involved in cell wall biosynthesis
VSVILAAYNEESVIRQKIENLLAVDYPADRLEILIGSDGSNDHTAEIAKSFNDTRIKAFDYQERAGKVSVLNRLVLNATHEILIFTDASEMFDPQAVRRLVANFADPYVGAVSGQLMMTSEDSNGSTQGVSAYWKYEKALRQMESRVYSMLGATGAIYAMRKSLYRPPASDAILDDVAIPMATVEEGYRVVFEPEALAYEKATDSAADEFKRKVRTLTGNYQEYFHLEKFLGRHSVKILFQVFSHKVLRLVAPFAMLGLLASSLVAQGLAATTLLTAQMAFFTMAFAGMALPQIKMRILSVPYMFTLMNTAAFLAFFRYFFQGSQLSGKRGVLWEKTKENLMQNVQVEQSGDVLQWVGAQTQVLPQNSFYIDKVKPAVDFAGATAGLVVTSPVMAAVAIAVRLDSPGPVIYQQERVGKDGRRFNIYKFRSMRADAETGSGAVWAKKNDPRVTKLGRFLRASHLDELPQLWNVLKGDMSLIGPRPERPVFVDEFSQKIDGYTDRLAIKPGITGLAQVLHKYDETLEDVKNKVRYDKEYIEKAGFRTDLKISWLTAKRMTRMENTN